MEFPTLKIGTMITMESLMNTTKKTMKTRIMTVFLTVRMLMMIMMVFLIMRTMMMTMTVFLIMRIMTMIMTVFLIQWRTAWLVIAEFTPSVSVMVQPGDLSFSSLPPSFSSSATESQRRFSTRRDNWKRKKKKEEKHKSSSNIVDTSLHFAIPTCTKRAGFTMTDVCGYFESAYILIQCSCRHKSTLQRVLMTPIRSKYNRA